MRVKALEPLLVPEPARSGESADDCVSCARPRQEFVWANQDWALQAAGETSLPGVVLLVTRGDYDSYADLPDRLATQLGPMTARAERALPRPLGAIQLRGSTLTMWLDLLPVLPAPQVDAALAVIAQAMRAADPMGSGAALADGH